MKNGRFRTGNLIVGILFKKRLKSALNLFHIALFKETSLIQILFIAGVV